MTGYEAWSPDHLKERIREPERRRLVDVRDLDEFAAVHVEGAVCVPLSQLLQRASQWSPREPLTLVCHSGQRAREAADQLVRAGFECL